MDTTTHTHTRAHTNTHTRKHTPAHTNTHKHTHASHHLQREKQMTAWDHLGIGQKPVDRVKWSEVSQKQRAFNPVTQKYIHTAREKSGVQKDLQRSQAALSWAKKKEEKYAFGAYDPITCSVKFANKIPKPKPRVMCIAHILITTNFPPLTYFLTCC